MLDAGNTYLSLRDLCPDVEMVDAGNTYLSLRDLCQQDDRVKGVVLWQRSWQSQIWEVEGTLRYLYNG